MQRLSRRYIERDIYLQFLKVYLFPPTPSLDNPNRRKIEISEATRSQGLMAHLIDLISIINRQIGLSHKIGLSRTRPLSRTNVICGRGKRGRYCKRGCVREADLSIDWERSHEFVGEAKSAKGRFHGLSRFWERPICLSKPIKLLETGSERAREADFAREAVKSTNF